MADLGRQGDIAMFGPESELLTVRAVNFSHGVSLETGAPIVAMHLAGKWQDGRDAPHIVVAFPAEDARLVVERFIEAVW